MKGHVYIVAPAHAYTGGPTALFQLCHYLSEYFNVDAKIAFTDIRSGEDPVHPNYRKFKCGWLPLQKVEDSPRNLMIFPETLISLSHRFRSSKKAIYWLAVDDFFLSLRSSSKLSRLLLYLLLGIKYRCIPSRLMRNDAAQYISYKEIIKAMKNLELRNFLNEIDLHIAQSEYAKNFLINLGVNKEKIVKLREPLEEEFLNVDVDFAAKQDIVTFNARKAFSIVNNVILKIKERDKAVKIIPLLNVGKEKMIKILSKSKVFIDIGFHPGRDRPAREAAVLGNVVIVNRRGGTIIFKTVQYHTHMHCAVGILCVET